MRQKQQVFRMLVIVGSITITAVIAEIALRVYWSLPGRRYELHPRHIANSSSLWTESKNPSLVYEHRPNYTKDGTTFTNGDGILQPHPVPKKKDPDTFRVVLIGDSIGAGIYLSYEQRFGTRLENMLNKTTAPKTRAEVLNFSVNGYGTSQEAALLETSGAAFTPDLLIVQYCMNDPGTSVNPTIWFTELPGSYLFQFLHERITWPAFVPTFGPDKLDYWDRLYAPESRPWKSVEAGFSQIDHIAKKSRIPVLLVIFPFLRDHTELLPVGTRFSRQVHDAGMTRGWQVLDLTPIYKQHEPESIQLNETDIYHPNQKGHELAAQHIFSRLLDTGIFPPVP